MATIVGEALLAASLEVLLEKIVSGEFGELFRSTKLDAALLGKLEITLVSLQAVLHDAEEKQITNPAVKQWLDMIRDAVFEAGDLFDEINTEALRRRVEAEYETRTATSQVLKKLSSRFRRFNRKVNSKLQKLFERLEHLRKQNLKLKECVSSSVWHGTPTSSVMVDESAIYGRDNDRKKLKEFLLSEDGSDSGSKIGVISIVGMGGLGKTTLAKLLYNDREVKKKFLLRGWAHISKDFDVLTVTKTILESFTSKRNDTDDLNNLQVQLLQCLSNTKFLLVLDDMWDGKYVDCWNNLTDIFNVGEIGSKIIITTRDERVAATMQTFLPIYKLEPLQSDHCWSLLAKHAFQASYNYEQRANLEVIGKEIAKKCHGLPLAAVALGGLLRIKSSPNDWNDVLKSSIWELAKDVQPALLLSYRYLPSALKGCFAYCSIFPKNSILEKKMVVQLWIAEGLVPQPKIKSVGAQFYGRGSPSFQSFPILETLEFDAMPEWEEWKFTDGTTTKFPRLTRLSLLRCPKLQGNIPFGQLGKLKELHIELMESLKTLGTEFYGSGSSPMFQSFPSLETLQFVNMPKWEEWELIGDTYIEFPSLTHLSLHNCPKLRGNVPGNLPSLTCLSVKCCPKLKGMTPNNLPSLSELELEKCPLLMKSRHSDNISYNIITRPSSDVFSQLMIGLNSLRKMKLSNIPSLTSFPTDGLPKTLQSLTIYDCRKLEFLPHESLQNYTSLDTLKISKSCNSMISINLCSLPVLKRLYICGCKNLKAVVIAEDTSQQNLLFLRTIKVEDCHELESVSLGGLCIPNLIHLTVSECKKLRFLPESMNTLASLQKMEIHDLPNLQSLSMDDFPISLRELSVGNVGGILWNTTWEHLTCLSVLLIAGDDIVKALMKTEVPLLPAFLVSLVICGVEDIKCLDGKWLQHLTSLQHFTILEAPKLESLPKAGKFPSSLKVLRVKQCPLLEESLRRKRGKEWRKVAHIPSILIDLEMIT
ncbi:hypothetical protein P8452_24516 [Trifolium repens]|nr:hypothetical protein P8452_24516 [Trifolium repens]